MSFLNPVSEPVLRFSSTDAGAPQINYNARVAGDVKTVLKACLVTGYGDKASAGWSIANEVNHVAEFVSPSVAMSDYRLGIDDTSTSSTTWYYQYQDVRVNPSYNAPIKSLSAANKTHASNGWQLLVTERGIMFIEIIFHTSLNKTAARLTYFGQVKSALPSSDGRNMMFFNLGHNGQIAFKSYLYATNYPHLSLAGYSSPQVFGSTIDALGASDRTHGVSTIDLASQLYIADSSKKALIAGIVGLLGVTRSNVANAPDVSDDMLDGRPVLSIIAAYAASGTADFILQNSASFLIYLDHWGY